MKKTILKLILFVLLFPLAFSCQYAKEEKPAYVPKNLSECFVELRKIIKPSDLKTIRNGTEDDLGQYHFGLGMWMRNNWGLWEGSALAQWFAERGIYHPDDMSSIILTSFWRHLNDKPIQLKDQIEGYIENWKIHGPPEDTSCPKCGLEMDFFLGAPRLDSSHPDDYIYIYCCDKGHVWNYFHTRGFYIPEKEEDRQRMQREYQAWLERAPK